MKAIVLKEQGGVENLILSELPIPKITPDDVLVNVKAISINPADTYIRKEKSLDYVFNGDNPKILGWDLSGTIVAIGDNVTGYKIGDDIFGVVNYPGHDHGGHGKAYAEYVAAPIKDVVFKPVGITHPEAAAATLAALTAWQP